MQHNLFYDLQKEHSDQDSNDINRKVRHESWFDERTVDYWRHQRFYDTTKSLASFYKDARWLSVGDGRYGLDAYRLKKLFGVNVFPTDISGEMLNKGKKLGLFSEYGVENAEALTFPDNNFDIVFCKEALHHCPRPMIAIYEMLRVAKDAVVLIEPNDISKLESPKKILKNLVELIFSVLRQQKIDSDISLFRQVGHDYEPSGNYVYTLSIRELCKVIQGIDLAGLAWKGINDYYESGFEQEIAEPNNKAFQKARRKIKKMNFRCQKFPIFYDYNIVSIVLFKNNVHPSLKENMKKHGYHFSNTTRNPYTTKLFS